MRIASIDIGTNTVLLLVADVDENGTIHLVEHQQRLPRLGKDVDKNGRIHVSAFDRVAWIVNEYKNFSVQLGAQKIIACATSAVRDASNRDEFISFIKSATGISVEVLSGNDEGLLTYNGALSGLQNLNKPVCVIDIGGGSTEITFPDGSRRIQPSNGNQERNLKVATTAISALQRYSLQVGSVRITERFFKHTPPLDSEIQSTIQFMIEEFAQVRNPGFSSYQLVAVAGTATTLACLDQGLDEFEIEKVSGYKMSREKVIQWAIKLSTMTPEQIRSLSNTTDGRADILTAGVLILNEAMKHFGFESVIVSERGLRYGMIIREWEKFAH